MHLILEQAFLFLPHAILRDILHIFFLLLSTKHLINLIPPKDISYWIYQPISNPKIKFFAVF